MLCQLPLNPRATEPGVPWDSGCSPCSPEEGSVGEAAPTPAQTGNRAETALAAAAPGPRLCGRGQKHRKGHLGLGTAPTHCSACPRQGDTAGVQGKERVLPRPGHPTGEVWALFGWLVLSGWGRDVFGAPLP